MVGEDESLGGRRWIIWLIDWNSQILWLERIKVLRSLRGFQVLDLWRPNIRFNRAQNTANKKQAFRFLCFLFDYGGFMGGQLFQNGELLMIPDRLQYFLEHFWNDQKTRPKLDPRTPYSSPKYCTTYEENGGDILEQYFSYMRVCLYEKMEGMRSIAFWKFGRSASLKNTSWTFDNWKSGNLEIENRKLKLW